MENCEHILTEQELLERRLKEQQKQSEEDSKWLLEKESNLVSAVLTNLENFIDVYFLRIFSILFRKNVFRYLPCLIVRKLALPILLFRIKTV